jgi:glutamate--cysteine ligase
MPTVGSHGVDMMLRTATVQLNLDYTSEENMVKMMRVIATLDPLISGLLSASPFVENRRSNYISYRNYVWQNTDEKRCNFNQYVFDEDMGFQKYLNWLLEVPMYFIQRNGYINVAGKSFKDFILGQLESYEGMVANLDDFYDHMRVAFPKARIKNYIEIRGLDSSPIAMSGVALWVGLLYGTKFDSIYQEIMNWDPKVITTLGQNIPHFGLKNYSINEKSLWSILQNLFEQSYNELILQKKGEEIFLKPLESLLEKQITYSEMMKMK